MILRECLNFEDWLVVGLQPQQQHSSGKARLGGLLLFDMWSEINYLLATCRPVALRNC
jgi:hypothetical protein